MVLLRATLLLLTICVFPTTGFYIDDDDAFDNDIEQEDIEDDAIRERTGMSNELKLWPGGVIPLRITDDIVGTHRDKILEALRIWEENTCLTFPDSADYTAGTSVKIYAGSGCSTRVGNNGKLDQGVSIAPICRIWAALHEIGHKIGLNHERSRPDRDDWMWFRDEYAAEGTPTGGTTPIELNGVNTYGFNYSYLSVMHPNAFKNAVSGMKAGMNEPTLVTLLPEYQFRLDTGGSNPDQRLSYEDIGVVNKMYKCGEHCTNDCDEGFLDKDCRCLCPGTTVNPTLLCSEPRPVEECVDSKSAAAKCARHKRNGQCPEKKWTCQATCALCGPECQDTGDDCLSRAKEGECRGNVAFMLEYCRETCGFCYGEGHEVKCWDKLGEDCMQKAAAGECQGSNADWMEENCPRSCASDTCF